MGEKAAAVTAEVEQHRQPRLHEDNRVAEEQPLPTSHRSPALAPVCGPRGVGGGGSSFSSAGVGDNFHTHRSGISVQLPSQFHNGLRISDAATVEVAEMVLGRLNKGLVAAIVAAGGRAVGLSGKDDGMIRTRKVIGDDGVDIGFVGEAEKIDTTLVNALLSMSPSVIPVIAPLGIGLTDGATYNINADTMAGAVAGALKADRLLLLTDVAGVLDGPPDDGGKLLPRLTRARVEELISGGTIYGGMIPKVQNALDAVEAGSGGASIVDGRETHAIFRALYTDSGGTLVEAS